MIFLLVILSVLILDQISKYLIEKNLSLGESVPVLENVFHLTYIRNKGAAFGLFSNWAPFLLFVTIITIIVIILCYRQMKKRNFTLRLAFSLILGGAFGNLLDRLLLGEVRDFLDFRIWPIFNLADTCVCLGVGLFLFEVIRKEQKIKKKEKEKEEVKVASP